MLGQPGALFTRNGVSGALRALPRAGLSGNKSFHVVIVIVRRAVFPSKRNNALQVRLNGHQRLTWIGDASVAYFQP